MNVLDGPAIFNAIKIIDLAGEAKSYCFTVSCVPESMFNLFISSFFVVISFVLTCGK